MMDMLVSLIYYLSTYTYVKTSPNYQHAHAFCQLKTVSYFLNVVAILVNLKQSILLILSL